MTEAELLEPVLGAGIQSTHYFNGRVLTAEDLRTDQEAQRRLRAVLGTAIGEGVVTGLDVTLATPASPPGGVIKVRVTRGVALNGDGDVVVLGVDTEVALVKGEDAELAEGGAFAVCQPPQATLTNPGLYILTILPASGTSGWAPMTELGGQGVASSCGARFDVGGAQFRMVALPISATGGAALEAEVAAKSSLAETGIVQWASLSGAAADSKEREIARAVSGLRNRVAYLCFGTDAMKDFATNPFPRSGGRMPGGSYGVLDKLHAEGALMSCEVPLALLYWSRRGVEYLDAWAARRPVTSLPASPPWSPVDRARRAADAVAMLLQFQTHLEDLRRALPQGELGQIAAKDWLRFLPPCGFVPVTGGGALSSFATSTFFRDLAAGAPLVIDHAKVEALAAEALLHPPVDTSVPAMLQLYRVTPPAGSTVQPYVLYVTRAAHGILEEDAVAKVFQSAWEAYRGLVRNRVFLPTEATANAATTRISMVAAVNDVMAVAAQKATLAAARRLAWRDATAAFDQLRAVQQDLSNLYRTGLAGVTDANRVAFGTQLNGLLNTGLPDGSAPLNSAIGQSNLFQAIKAQQAINAFVSTNSGEGAAHGDILITYTGDSPDGITLVRSGPTRHRFLLFNRTDRMLDIQLTASVAGTGDWVGNLPGGNTMGGAVEVQAPEGTAVSNLVVPGTGTTAVGVPFTVAVKAPTNAVDGTATATLNIDASVGAPHNKSFRLTKEFDVGATSTPPTTRGVAFIASVSDPVDNSVPPGLRSYSLSVDYSDSQGPRTTPFTFILTVAASDASTGWDIGATDFNVTRTNPDARTLVATTDPVNLDSAATATPFNIDLKVPSGAGRSATITVRVESTETNPSDRISDEYSWTLTVV